MELFSRIGRDALGQRHEQFMKGEVTSFVVVVVMEDGTTIVDFDLTDAQDLKVHNKMGGGLMQAIDHLRHLAVEKKMMIEVSDGVAGHA